MIQPLTPEQIIACQELREKPGRFGRQMQWRSIGKKLGISQHSVLQYFAPDELAKYRAQLIALRVVREKQPGVQRPPISDADLATIRKLYIEGRGLRGISNHLPKGIGRKTVSQVLASFDVEIETARVEHKRRKKDLAYARELEYRREANKRAGQSDRYGVRPSRAVGFLGTGRAPDYVLAERDRRLQLRAECRDPNVLILGDPVR